MRVLKAVALGIGVVVYIGLGMAVVLGLAMLGYLLFGLAILVPSPFTYLGGLLGAAIAWFAWGTVRLLWLPWHPGDYRQREVILRRWRCRRLAWHEIRRGRASGEVVLQLITGGARAPYRVRATATIHGDPPLRTFPLCPTCGSAMVIRTGRHEGSKGEHFWRCSRFPRCTETKPYLG